MGRKVSCSFRILFGCWCIALLWGVSPARAVPPAETLLPDTTKGFVAVPSMTELREKWNATQLGHLVNDPVMQPFVEDLQRQLKARMDQAGGRIGLVWQDLEGVYGGELCVAAVQPWDGAAAQKAIQAAADQAAAKAKEAKQNEQQVAKAGAEAAAAERQAQDKKRQEQHSLVLLMDVTGHIEQANALVKKITDDLMQRGAKKSTTKIQGVDMLSLDVTTQREGKPATNHTAYYCIHQDMLVATDNQSVAEGILKRMGGDTAGSLSQSAAFAAVMAKSRESFGDKTPQAKWFVEPFGMVEVLRGMNGGRKRRGTDVLKVVMNQGFTAIQGVGGFLALADGEHEMLYSTYVYAPPVTRKEGDTNTDKYDLAARMLNFPNAKNDQPPAWTPRELATYATFRWNLQDAFRYAETLVNEYAGDEAVFQDVLKSIETDPNGPMINLEKDLVAHLGDRIVVFADCRIPVTPKSERVLVAVSLKDVEAVRQTINKAMESDPEAQRRDHNGHIIWEMVAEQPIEVETVQIDGPGFGFEAAEDTPAPEEEEDKPFRPNGAITIAKDHLIVSTHLDYIEQLLDTPNDAESLSTDGEYQLVEVALDKLGAGDDSARFFSRTDEAYRATYELVRQGKMPEAETILAKLLNRIFEPEEDGVVREPYIDGSKLPEYDAARRYLGPGGFFVRTEDNGWALTGCLMSKQAP